MNSALRAPPQTKRLTVGWSRRFCGSFARYSRAFSRVSETADWAFELIWLCSLLCSATRGFPSFLLQPVAARTRIWSCLVTHLPGPSGSTWRHLCQLGLKAQLGGQGPGDEVRQTRFRVTRWWGQAHQDHLGELVYHPTSDSVFIRKMGGDESLVSGVGIKSTALGPSCPGLNSRHDCELCDAWGRSFDSAQLAHL